MDGAPNNMTMIQEFSLLLQQKGISYDPLDSYLHCFAHIVNLCSHRVMDKFCEIHNDANTYDDDYNEDTPALNPLTKCRKTVQVIRASGQRRDDFADIIKEGNARGYFKDSQGVTVTLPVKQLLHDVCTRWDSVLWMINRSRILRAVSFHVVP